MKILHFGRIEGGVETSVLQIASNLNPDLFQQVVVTNNANKVYRDKYGSEIKVYKLKINRLPNPIADIKTLVRLFSILRAESPDIIHCHSSKGGLIGRLVSLFIKAKIIYTPQAFSFLSSPKRVSVLFILLHEKLLRRRTDLLLACSDSEKLRALNQVKFPSKKVKVWNNSIDVVEANNVSEEENYIINLGRPSYQKNTLELIDVMDNIVNKHGVMLKLKLVGVGKLHSPLTKEVRETIRKRNLADFVELIDWKDRTATMKDLANAKCYISTSRYEGLPYALIEAMSLGVPIVASNTDGNKDCVKEGVTGFLIEPGAIESYGSAIISIVTDDRLRNKFGSESKIIFNREFNIRNNIEELEGIYMQSIEN